MQQDLVRSIAESVRYWTEGRAVGTIGEEDLSGWCAIASAELFRQLKVEGISSQLYVWVCPKDRESAHVYLVVDDYVVDITCTQFSKMRGIPVFIEHVREAVRFDWYGTPDEVFNSVEDLIRYQKKTRWTVAQIAWAK